MSSPVAAIEARLPVGPDPVPWRERVRPGDRLVHGVMPAYASFGVVLFAGLLLTGWWMARSTGDLVKVAAAVWAPVGALVALALHQFLVSRRLGWSRPSRHC